MDTYPVNQPMLVIMDPDTAREVANSNLKKHWNLKKFVEPLAGTENLLLLEGAVWKKWRNVFNPSFSPTQLMSQVPTIVDYVTQFVAILDERASKNELFRMEEEATKVTIDVIGKVVCDHEFKTLTTDNEFVQLLRSSLTWMPDSQSFDPFHRHHPLRPLFWKYYKYRMDNYIGKVLDERFTFQNASKENRKRQKTGIDLALEEYFKESGQTVDARTATMDSEFRRYAIDNLQSLLFAGHDTTASTICYCYHELGKHPAELQKLRRELDDVFGVGVDAGEQIKHDPYIINKCDYTSAVIKEILRMWAPASTVREGRKDYFIKDPVTEEMLPTDKMLVWIPAISIHRDARYWGEDAHIFRPERWLPENADELPSAEAYRPFERGPRNCIGQELANIELKILLAMTIREFDIRSAFDELDTLDTDGSLWAADQSFKKGVQKCFDDEMYQILLAAGKPRQGMPARVKRRRGLMHG
ncbi:cytochrome P450 [Amniculicola lignicola CBS 123094]|uniref:Cytochrome P450 n=1 Tax=Amniculicola lignicola CBS 123094 TaxID=1392246 RepID=A0A6A5WSR5_9PLEO|nr:cytochrome P450 [Amniculicola lignicola CBS 123094]